MIQVSYHTGRSLAVYKRKELHPVGSTPEALRAFFKRALQNTRRSSGAAI